MVIQGVSANNSNSITNSRQYKALAHSGKNKFIFNAPAKHTRRGEKRPGGYFPPREPRDIEEYVVRTFMSCGVCVRESESDEMRRVWERERGEILRLVSKGDHQGASPVTRKAPLTPYVHLRRRR